MALSIGYQGAGVCGFCNLKCMIFQVVAVYLVRDLYSEIKHQKYSITYMHSIHPDSPYAPERVVQVCACVCLLELV